MNDNTISRRTFLKLGSTAGLLAGLGHFTLAQAQSSDYKALVCIFLFGGNDGHNTVIPMSGSEYAAYQSRRGSLALTGSKLLPITAANGGQYALNYGLVEMQPLFQSGKLAVVANTGILNTPTTLVQYQQHSVPLPTQLFSHSDQIVQMQSGVPNTSSSSGWGGRVADAVEESNTNATGPVSISFNGSALYCAGMSVVGTNLQPGNNLYQNAMSSGYPQAAIDARAAAQQQLVSLAGSNRLMSVYDKGIRDAWQLNGLLRNLGSGGFTTQFPNSILGNQLKDVARFISLRQQTGVGRQVFFCGLGGFDTHSGQDYQQWDLLRQVSAAMQSFYDATAEMGVAGNVTTFTLSDFGRSLQPSGTGTDHGWGNHSLVMGGSVLGQRIYGRFPIFNPNDSAYDPNAFVDSRGILLPSTSLAQFGATLGKWMGAESQLETVFPELAHFTVKDLGFMA